MGNASDKYFKNGIREVDYRFELLDNDNSVIGDITSMVEEAEISNNSFSTIQRTAKFKVSEVIKNSPTVVQNVSKRFWHGDVRPDSWTGDYDTVKGLINYPLKETSANIDGAFNSPLITDPLIIGSYPDKWVARSGSGSGEKISRISGSGAITLNAMKFEKSTEWSNYLLLESKYEITLKSTPVRAYFTGFYYSPTAGVLYPDVFYTLKGAGGTIQVNQCPYANMNITRVDDPETVDGWRYFEGYVDLPVTGTYTKASMGIGAAWGIRTMVYDQFWFSTSRTSRFTFEVEALSPVIDVSIPNANGNDSVFRSSGSYSTFDVSPQSEKYQYVKPSTNTVEVRKRTNGGAWSSWLPFRPITGIFSDGEVMTNKEIQLRWRASSYQKLAPVYVSLSRWEMKIIAETSIANPAATGINYRRHRIKPYLRINEGGIWKEYPTGVFLLNTPTRNFDGTTNTREIEAYDQMVTLMDAKTTSPLVLTPDPVKGWAQIVRNILTYTNMPSEHYMGFKFAPAYVDIGNSTAGYKSKKRIYDMGTPWLTIINDLLTSSGLEGLWFDSNGVATSRLYQTANTAPTKFTYKADQTSIIFTDIEETIDTFETANVFVIAQQADEYGFQLVGKYTNDNQGSPSSTVEQGRYIVDYREVDFIESRAEMDSYVSRVAFNASQVYSQIRVDTALDPSHENLDKIRLDYQQSRVVGDFTETAWVMHFNDKPYMEHRLRRIVSI